MTQFYEIAKRAGYIVMAEKVNSLSGLIAIWHKTAMELSGKESVAIKGCPKGAFLGLLLKDERIGKNAKYALDALKILKQNPYADKNYLWNNIAHTAKSQNGQMDVLLALWNDKELREYFLL
ncbi:MAG: hypothetical protein LBV09_07600 [Deferribacteraceae bacterium]|jgi:hypothetical protein|nr:hypothetical protein [Deferribacteraceae bacterium]